MKPFSACFLLRIILTFTPAIGESEFPRTNVDLPSFCGPNCLTVFLKMNGIDAELEEICHLAGKNSEGTSLQGLQIAAHAKGIYSAGVKVTSAKVLKEMGYPAIVLLKTKNKEQGHFVLATDYDSGIKVINPPYVPYIKAMRAFDKRMEGSVLLLSTSPIVLPDRSNFLPIASFVLICVVLIEICVNLKKLIRSKAERACKEKH